MTKKKKFFILLPYLLLAVIILLIADYYWEVSGFKKSFHLEITRSINFNEDFNEVLKESKAFVSMHQINVINRNSDDINFTIYSEEEVKIFRLLDFKIIYKNNEAKIKRDILYELKTDNPNFFKTISKEKLIYQYNVFGGFENFKRCKINFKKLFSKKGINLGDKFPVIIIIHYFLDNNEYFQEEKFICECIEDDSYPPNWFMFFFPGAW